MKKIMLLAFIACSSTFAANAQYSTGDITTSQAQYAQSDRAMINNTFGFGPRMGYYKASDASEGNFYGGLQFRGRFGSAFGIEGSLEYRAGQEYGIGGFSVRTSFIPITTSLLLFLPLTDFSPYGLAGVGAYYTIYSYSEALRDLGFETDNEFNFGYHLGFGLEVPFSPNLAINVDYRYLFLNPNDNERSLDGASFDGNVFTAGLMFYF